MGRRQGKIKFDKIKKVALIESKLLIYLIQWYNLNAG